MVVVIISTRHLLYPAETKIIGIGLLKRKNYVDKVFAQPGHISKPLLRRQCDHRFGRMNVYFADLLKLVDQFIKKRNSMRAFAIEKIGQQLIVTGMRLVGSHEVPFA